MTEDEIKELSAAIIMSRHHTKVMGDNIYEMMHVCHTASVDGGWWHDLETGEKLERDKLGLLMLIVTEIAECAEGVRKGIQDDHLPEYSMEEVELADALIRIFDYAEAHDLRVGEAFVDKLEYNKTRADHKPENRAKPGGKKC